MLEELFGSVEVLLKEVYMWIKVGNDGWRVVYGKF